jgi:hypothetical protein
VNAMMALSFLAFGLFVGLVIGREAQVVIHRRKDAEWARFLNETRRQLNGAYAVRAMARAEIHRLRGIGERHEEVRS